MQEIEKTHSSEVRDLHNEAYRLSAEREAFLQARAELEGEIRNLRNETQRFRAEHEEALRGRAELQAELQIVQAVRDDMRDALERLTDERDGWMQELFETNRHVAYLAQQRQNLLELYGSQPEREQLILAIDRLREEAARHQSVISNMREKRRRKPWRRLKRIITGAR